MHGHMHSGQEPLEDPVGLRRSDTDQHSVEHMIEPQPSQGQCPKRLPLLSEVLPLSWLDFQSPTPTG